MSNQEAERFTRLLKSLALRDITPMEVHSRRLGNVPRTAGEVKIAWNQALATDDPVAPSSNTRVFRPKFELSVKHGEEVFFHQTSVFILAFSLVDPSAFEELWADHELRRVFTERQLQRTMWPLFRQHVLDGMSRLGMPAIALPWLM